MFFLVVPKTPAPVTRYLRLISELINLSCSCFELVGEFLN